MAKVIDVDVLYRAIDSALFLTEAEKASFKLLLRSIYPYDPDKHGKWIMRGGKLYCSKCGQKAAVARDKEDFWYTEGTDCCPSCGARMDGE